MTLSAPIKVVHVQEVADHGPRIAQLEDALRKLRWRRREGDEHHAERIEREIAYLKGNADG